MRNFDVIIVGNSLLAYSCASALKTLGCPKVAMVHSSTQPSRFCNYPGFILGQWIDNFTRIHHAFGEQVARKLWEFSEKSFAEVKAEFADVAECRVGELYRVIRSDHEAKEAQRAVELLASMGFDADYQRVERDSSLSNLFLEGTSLQRGARLGGSLSFGKMLAQCQAGFDGELLVGIISEVQEAGSHLELVLQDGSSLKTQLMVVTDEAAMISLYPDWQDILIPYADEWAEYRVECLDFDPGSVCIFRHGADIVHAIEPNLIRMTGGRRTRKFAGIGQKEAALSDGFPLYFEALAKEYFPSRARFKCLQRQPFVDYRPCDELPVLGPLFGSHRVLVGCGFMGQEATWGVTGGRYLSDLIMKGTCDDLPRILWPERLRSLSEA